MRIFLRKGSAGFLCLCLSLTFSKISPAVSLTWNTFLGGNSNNRGNVVAVDSTGHVYMAGWSNTTWGTPVRPYSGDYDAFVAKLDENGNLLWNTFLGGTGHDYAHAIAVASNGDVLVGGGSWDDWGNPVQPYVGGIPAFLARLDAQGNLIWNTFAGSALGENQILGIVLTPQGKILISGWSDTTWGSPIRPISLLSDAFVAMLDSGGNVLWNTFLGGNGWDGDGTSIELDNGGNILVAGTCADGWGSPILPYSGSTYNAFAAKLDGTGHLLWNTCLGENGSNRKPVAITTNSSGDILVAGTSASSWGTPLRPFSGDSAAFVARLNPNGNLIWNTFFGDTLDTFACGVRLDASGKIIIGGTSTATWGSPLRAFGGGASDVFLAKLDGGGSLEWNLFLGGNGADSADGGGGETPGDVLGGSILAALNGSVYLAGGSDASWGDPVLPYGTGSMKAFVAKVFDTLPPTSTATPTLTAIPTLGEDAREEVGLLHSQANVSRNQTIRLLIRLTQAKFVKAEIFTLTGRRFGVLLDRVLPSGETFLDWNANGAGSGLYFLKISLGSRVEWKKVVVIQ